MKILREPLVQFMLIGISIYLLYSMFTESVVEDTDKTIVVSAGELEWMKSSWQKRWNRPPTEVEFDGLIQQYIRETVLYREALTMGLNKHDQVIRRRLAQKLEFLAKDLVSLTPASEEDLQVYFKDNRKRYTEPPRYTFTQVYIDPGKRGDATLDDVNKIKAVLIEQGDAIEDPGALGDGFMLQTHYREKDDSEIKKQFGTAFTESLIKLSPGQWHGPILSGYGVHLVYVHGIIEPPAASFVEVRKRVLQDWESEKSEALNQQFYDSLRDQYTIVIEDTVKKDNNKVVKGQAQ